MNNWNGKKVFVTGHTGFKGTWLCEILRILGADVIGYALEPETSESVFKILNTSKKIKSYYGDIRDYENLKKVFSETNPEIVFHLAAQPIVRTSYNDPRYTYDTNVMGTVNILECCRLSDTVRSVVNVTTDKVYKNNEWCWGYRETDELNGYDPYSNSKSCSELVTDSYRNSFFNNQKIAVSTVRAGNVIGGGDFSVDRIIPDCVRAMIKKEPIIIRNPNSVRPFQHVLEPLAFYLMIALKQLSDVSYSGCYNIGPDFEDCISAGELAEKFCKAWGDNANWIDVSESNAPHEAGFLKLDCSKIKSLFKWNALMKIDDAVIKTVEWYKAYICGDNMDEFTMKQIDEYMGRML